MSRKWKDFAAAAAVLLLLPCAAALLGGAELPGLPREMGGRAGSAGDSGAEGQADSGAESQAGSGAAVSYTHLDVYKRQPPGR